MPETIHRKREEELDDDMLGEDIDGLPDPDGFDHMSEGDESRDDGDSFDEGVRLSNVTLPPPERPPRNRPAPRQRKTPMTEVQKRVADSLTGILDNLEFGTDAHKINVARIEPGYDLETGTRISGLLESFRRPIEVEDIQKRFGGGIYAVTVHGPGGNGRKAGIVARRQVEIAGPPKKLPNPNEETRKRELEENKSDSLIENLMEREERRSQQQRVEAMELRKEVARQQTTMIEMVTKAREGGPDPTVAVTAALAPILQSMSDQQARLETQRIEDLRRSEDRRKDERDQQRRRDEDRDRQWKAEQENQKRQFELQMANIKADQDRAEAQAKAQTESERNNNRMMMEFMSKSDAEKNARSQDSAEMQMKMFAQMNEQNSKFSEAQIKMLQSQLNGKDDFFGSIEKFATIRDLFNPPDPGDDRPGWERAVDKIGEMATPFVPGLVSMATGQVQQAPGAAAPLPPGGGPRRVAPGTVVYVDDIDGEAGAPQLTSPEVLEAQEIAKEPEAQEQEVKSETQVNQLTEFPEEYSADFTQSLTMLVMALDLALQREMSPDEMYEKCVAKLPTAQRLLLKGLGPDVLIDYIEEKAGIPDTWAIRSLEAEDKIRALHAKLVSEG